MSWKEWGAGQPDYCLLLESLENSKRVPPWMDGGARRREDDEELFPKLARWQLWGYDQGQGQFAGEPSSPRETKPRPRSAGNSETCRRTPTSPWCWSRSLHHDDTLRVWPSSEVSTALASIATCAASHDFRKLAWAGWGQKSSAIKQLPSEVWQHIVQYLWPRYAFCNLYQTCGVMGGPSRGDTGDRTLIESRSPFPQPPAHHVLDAARNKCRQHSPANRGPQKWHIDRSGGA
ncbi:hypothetical protein DIPPA_29550 [Diplonema papillatum]|nr:hypothetical protein DIPPA_29731 [Diplonema papillatum]KAJ9438056.1 hypothetical protein DIPPA_29731 [Diplonema papillatum]KAJ9438058.1 hypothetical protein DIPPA_29731 [Diplonema papillatum]KAJ9438059.1 hypothetical protein DIPPA_29731 [Diplonema papillatum]KAJ9438060.1 hypothetical protein DIPPA_29731 [Diplonema papillatum]